MGRIAFTAVVFSAIIALSVPMWLVRLSATSTEPDVPICMDDEMQEQIRTIMLAALDKGLGEHTVHVFNNWLKDPSDQPKRATAGMRVGVSAYVRSRAAMNKWDPPRCGGKQ